jgi:drug/metabolite transporter (DMT)-like permease
MITLVLLVNALFALVLPLGKLILQYQQPLTIIALRMILGGFILLGYVSTTRGIKFPRGKPFVRDIFLLALFNVFLTNAGEFWGLQHMSAAKTCFIYNLSPFFSAFFGYLYFKERMTNRKWLGLMISFMGFIPMMMVEAPEEFGLVHIGFLSSAEIALLIATISMVYGWIVMQHLVRYTLFDTLTANGVSMIIGGLMSGVGAYFFESWHSIPTEALVHFIGLLLLIILISNLICYTLYASLLKTYTATFMAFSGLTGPLFAALFDWLFFGTLVTWHFYGATLVVFLGLYLFYQEDLRQGYLV